MFMATLDNLVMTNALPVIGRELGSSVVELQWFVNAFTLVFASLMLLVTGLGDRFGRRTIFLVGISVFALASVGAALSTTSAALIAARAVQGLGAAGIMPLSLALLSDAVAPKLRPLAIGIWGGISGLGIAVGPLVGGAIISGWNWQAIFWVNLPVAAVSIPLALMALGNGVDGRSRLDFLGTLVAGGGVFALVYGIVRGNDLGWSSGTILAALAAGAVLLVGFFAWQHRASAPLIPLRLFRDRSFSVANAVSTLFSFGMFGSIFLLMQYLQIGQGRTALQAGVLTMPWTLAPMIVAPLAGMIVPRIGTRALLMVGQGLQAAGLVWLGLALSTDLSYQMMVPAFIMAGVGMGLTFAPGLTAVLANITPDDSAKASGTNATLRELGGALGIAVLTVIFTSAGGTLTPSGFVSAARPAILIGAVVLVLSTTLAAFLPAGRSTEQTQPA
jgi:EmrB/QacA subfamily drug resistance transporter